MGLFEPDENVVSKKPKAKKVQALSLPPTGANFATVDLDNLNEKQVASGIIVPRIDYIND